MSAKQARQDVVDLGLKKARNESALLRAVLLETESVYLPMPPGKSYDFIEHIVLLQGKLRRLRALAVTIRDTGDPLAAVHPTHGITLDDESDYGEPNVHLPTEED